MVPMASAWPRSMGFVRRVCGVVLEIDEFHLKLSNSRNSLLDELIENSLIVN